MPQVTLEEAQEVHRRILVFDGHNDTPVERVARKEIPFAWMEVNDHLHMDVPRMQEGGFDGGFFIVGNGPSANVFVTLENTLAQLDAHGDKLQLVLSSADAIRAKEDGKIGILMGIEGAGRWLNGALERAILPGFEHLYGVPREALDLVGLLRWRELASNANANAARGKAAETFEGGGGFGYGCEQTRTGYLAKAGITTNTYIRRHHTGSLELVAMMLDVYHMTDDETFAREMLIPTASSILRFVYEHYEEFQGKLLFRSQALETEQEWSNARRFKNFLESIGGESLRAMVMKRIYPIFAATIAWPQFHCSGLATSRHRDLVQTWFASLDSMF